MKHKELKFSKNVTLKGSSINAVQTFMSRTNQNFSATLNIIILQWVEYRVELANLKNAAEQEVKHLKEAKVIKE